MPSYFRQKNDKLFDNFRSKALFTEKSNWDNYYKNKYICMCKKITFWKKRIQFIPQGRIRLLKTLQKG